MEAVEVVEEVVPSGTRAGARDDMMRPEPQIVLRFAVERLQGVVGEDRPPPIIVVIGLDLERGVLARPVRPPRQQVLAVVAVAGQAAGVGAEDVALDRDMVALGPEIAPEAGLPPLERVVAAGRGAGGQVVAMEGIRIDANGAARPDLEAVAQGGT